MDVKTVKVSEKGQIAIPLGMREAMGLEKGDELILMQEGGKMLLEKATAAAGALKDEFAPLLKAAEKTAKELWDNKQDEVWNDV